MGQVGIFLVENIGLNIAKTLIITGMLAIMILNGQHVQHLVQARAE